MLLYLSLNELLWSLPQLAIVATSNKVVTVVEIILNTDHESFGGNEQKLVPRAQEEWLRMNTFIWPILYVTNGSITCP